MSRIGSHFFLLLILLLSANASTVSAQAFDPEADLTRKSHKSILDYYMILPKEVLACGKLKYYSSRGAKNPDSTEYARRMEAVKVLDIKNGYLETEDKVLTLFRRRYDRKDFILIAPHPEKRDCEGPGLIIQSLNNTRRWYHNTMVLPDEFHDFESYSYVLPRHGTAVKVVRNDTTFLLQWVGEGFAIQFSDGSLGELLGKPLADWLPVLEEYRISRYPVSEMLKATISDDEENKIFQLSQVDEDGEYDRILQVFPGEEPIIGVIGKHPCHTELCSDPGHFYKMDLQRNLFIDITHQILDPIQQKGNIPVTKEYDCQYCDGFRFFPRSISVIGITNTQIDEDRKEGDPIKITRGAFFNIISDALPAPKGTEKLDLETVIVPIKPMD